MAKNDRKALLIPGRTFFIAALLYFVLGCISFFFDNIYLFWFFAGICLVPVILTDLLLHVFFCDRLKIEREIPSSLAQNETVRVRLVILSACSARLMLSNSVYLYDLFPESMKTDVFPVKLFKSGNVRKNFKTSGRFVFEYNLMPEKRGQWHFSGAEILLSSPLHFWRLRVTHAAVNSGRTYPNFKNLAQGMDLRGNPEKGEIRRIRRRGQGMEFESLRDYNEGDPMRSVDWRATSRNRGLDGKTKLIVRDYQEEQDQQVLFIIDSGYRLPDSQFDSALEAMLMLSFIALKRGDSVGAASFGGSDVWIPPRKGISAYNGLMNRLYDLHSAPVPSSPLRAMENALNLLNRRSFIILISNFREEDGESLSWILPRINKRHLLLMVSFMETSLYELAGCRGNKTEDDILDSAAAYSYLANRRRLYRTWEHSGLLVLETSPEQISSALINKYLNIKKSGVL